ncbi:MAG: hypothetical protein Q9212_003969 [Teloschistes hypoglaucus]
MTTKPVKGPIPTTSLTSTLLPNVILIISASTPVTTVSPAPVTSTTTQTVQTTVTQSATPKSKYLLDNLHQHYHSGKHANLNRPKHKYRDRIDDDNFGIKYIQVTYTKKIVAVKPTSTVTGKPSTSTVTSTVTSTSTSTVVPPDVSVTSSFTTTATATAQTNTTVTNFGTTTTTVTQVVTQTSYDACKPTNILGPRTSAGQYIDYVDYSRFDTGTDSNAKDALDCCVQCQTNNIGNGCQFSVFTPSQKDCLNFISTNTNTCSNPNYQAGNIVVTNGPNSHQI